MADIVLVPGGFHGGWYFDPIVGDLVAAGHRVSAVTLPGLEPGARADEPVNLDTHVAAVRTVIREHGFEDVVLVGHSYAGAVITGVAALMPDEVSHLIHLDTVIPRPGQSVWEQVSTEIQSALLGACDDGFTVIPDPGLAEVDPRVVAHPIATFLQRLHFDEAALTMPKSYFSAAEGPYTDVYRTRVDEPGWECTTHPYGHDLLREAPAAVSAYVLERVAAHAVQRAAHS
jgi:pimeloyl-ACP methyl ester carboxylesterase